MNTSIKVWESKVFWLTGASKGIGKSVALKLIDAGAIVIGTSRDESTLRAVSNSSNFVPMSADVNDYARIAEIATEIDARFGKLDVLIANAGVCEYINMPDFNSDVLEKVMRINYMGCVKTIEVALPLIRKSTNGYIVSVASSNAYLGLPRAEAYGPSKAAIYNLMQSLKADLAKESIDVSVVCPGFVETELTDKNDFAMPMKITADKAAVAMLKDMEKRHFDIHFPKRFTIIMRMVARLPDFILYRLTAKLSRNVSGKKG